MRRSSGRQTRLTPPGRKLVLPCDSLHADEFDVLVRDLLPRVRQLLPELSDIEVLRAAARMAEYRLSGERTLMGIDFRDWG